MNCYKSTAIIITNEIFFMLLKSMLHTHSPNWSRVYVSPLMTTCLWSGDHSRSPINFSLHHSSRMCKGSSLSRHLVTPHLGVCVRVCVGGREGGSVGYMCTEIQVWLCGCVCVCVCVHACVCDMMIAFGLYITMEVKSLILKFG